mmetsp:Transcript_43729/g.105470  ORF Transcript_43729/g.105470 Transcript_43729/m.105470 type:complete len:80 (-) Transcript_43729:1160-1399(-)
MMLLMLPSIRNKFCTIILYTEGATWKSAKIQLFDFKHGDFCSLHWGEHTNCHWDLNAERDEVIDSTIHPKQVLHDYPLH